MDLKKLIKVFERIWFFIKIPLFLLVFLTLFQTFVFTVFVVDGPSMVPTLLDKQIILVDKISYLLSSPQKNDVIVLQFPGDPDKRIFVKRVIATPGTSLDSQEEDKFGEVANMSITLGSGQYYVLGDNRRESGDSRLWGPVPRENILGRTLIDN